jgi:hypothetical protein
MFKECSVFSRKQDDRIGRIFAYWAIAFFGQFLKTAEGALTFLATFFQSKNYVSNLTRKIVWATFWTTFPQTHLVALVRSQVFFGVKQSR